MRAYLDILLSDNGVIRLHEITPFHYKQALLMLSCDSDKTMNDIDASEWDTVLNQLGLIEVIKQGKPNENEQTLIQSRFLFVNNGFFENKQHKTLTDRRPLSNIIEQLNQLCAALIAHHHIDVWNYGWSFFNVCIEQHKDNG